MRLFSVVSKLILCSFVFVAASASAQTQNVPVSCTWQTVNVSSGASGANVTRQCSDGGSVIATQVLSYRAGQPTTCSLSPASGINYSGSCESPSFYRTVAVIVPPCPNTGVVAVSGCGTLVSTPAASQQVAAICGASCGATSRAFGAINGCSQNNPYVVLTCK